MNIKISQTPRIIIQILIWLGLLIAIYVGNGVFLSGALSRAVYSFLGISLLIITNTLFLFPKFYHRSKLLFFLSSLGFVLCLAILINLILNVFYGGDQVVVFIVNGDENSSMQAIRSASLAAPLVMTFVVSTLIETTLVANASEQETTQLRAEKLETELKFLKSQINPHFLFNSLNNIYSLTILDPDRAGENVLKLSAMLRYLLYECDEEHVLLKQELQYLQNYINLFAQKEEQSLNIKVDFEQVVGDLKIAPLLLIPFVENAFKHSFIEDLVQGWVEISLKNDQKTIYFEVKNSVPGFEMAKDEVGGIGLQNIKRQLELLYPNKHQLEIRQTKDVFEISLELEI
ncbi:MAG: histidine kinase [Saprospiraceae bacterium]|nr:histidine kinase [Saprospiraceae bacterium]